MKEDLSPTVLLRFEMGAVPVVFWNSAFWSSIALAASGNMDLIVLGSSPDMRFAPGEGGGLVPKDPRDPSTLSLFMASFMREDMGSFSPKAAGERTPDMGWLLAICCRT